MSTVATAARIAAGVLLTICAMPLTGCARWEEPPNETIAECVNRNTAGTMSYQIVNHYTRTIGDETWHMYDLSLTLPKWPGASTRRIVGFVKRGEIWYSEW